MILLLLSLSVQTLIPGPYRPPFSSPEEESIWTTPLPNFHPRQWWDWPSEPALTVTIESTWVRTDSTRIGTGFEWKSSMPRESLFWHHSDGNYFGAMFEPSAWDWKYWMVLHWNGWEARLPVRKP